ncbi:MAG: hypothetical protein K2Z81_22315, partial [Cyanobacteria bacterium]|nr:hypothetical protein [Cyanobacteriota bacterium]
MIWILGGLHIWLSQVRSPFSFELIEANLLMLAAISLTNSHVAATLILLYGKKDLRKQFWFHSLVMPVVVLLLLVSTLASPVFRGLFIWLFIFLSIDHTIAQNYGVTLMYCHKGGYVLERWEKWCLKIIHHSLTWFAILRLLTFDEWIPRSYLGYNIPPLVPMPAQFAITAARVVMVSVVIFALAVLRKSITSGKLIPLPALFLLGTTIFFYTCGYQLSLAFLFVPTLLHATQYFAVLLRRNQDEQKAGAAEVTIRSSKRLFLFCSFLLGVALLNLTPLLLTYGGIPHATAWMCVFISVNLQHYLADRDIW